MADEPEPHTYAEGDHVEVFDRDRGRWCPGVIQTLADTAMGGLWTVRADHETEYDLPLVWGVPTSSQDELLRPLP